MIFTEDNELNLELKVDDTFEFDSTLQLNVDISEIRALKD
jgi:hypothetical protein